MSSTFNAAFVPSVNAKFRPLGEVVPDQHHPKSGQYGSAFSPTGANTVAAVANASLLVAISQQSHPFGESLPIGGGPVAAVVPSLVYFMSIPANNTNSNHIVWRQAAIAVAEGGTPSTKATPKTTQDQSSLYEFAPLLHARNTSIAFMAAGAIDVEKNEEQLSVPNVGRKAAGSNGSIAHVICFPPVAVGHTVNTSQANAKNTHSLLVFRAFEPQDSTRKVKPSAKPVQPSALWRLVYVQASKDSVDLCDTTIFDWIPISPTSDPHRGTNIVLFMVKHKHHAKRRKSSQESDGGQVVPPQTISIVSIDFTLLTASIVAVCRDPNGASGEAFGKLEHPTEARIQTASKLFNRILGLELFSVHLLPTADASRMVGGESVPDQNEDDGAHDAFDVSSDRGSEEEEGAKPEFSLPEKNNKFSAKPPGSPITFVIAGGRDAATYRPNDSIILLTSHVGLASLHLYGACPKVAPTTVLDDSLMQSISHPVESPSAHQLVRGTPGKFTQAQLENQPVDWATAAADFTDEELAALEGALKSSPFAAMNDVSFRTVMKPNANATAALLTNSKIRSAMSLVVPPTQAQPKNQETKKSTVLERSFASSAESEGEDMPSISAQSKTAPEHQRYPRVNSRALSPAATVSTDEPIQMRLNAAAETLKNIKIPRMPSLKKRVLKGTDTSPRLPRKLETGEDNILPPKKPTTSQSPRHPRNTRNNVADAMSEPSPQHLICVEVSVSPPQTEMAFAPWLYKYDASKRALLWISSTVTYRIDPLHSRPKWEALIVRGNRRLKCGPALPDVVMAPVAELPLCALSGAGRLHIIVNVESDSLSQDPLVRNASELEMRQLSTLYIVTSGDGPARRWRVVVWDGTTSSAVAPSSGTVGGALTLTLPSPRSLHALGTKSATDASASLPAIPNTARRSNVQQSSQADALRPHTAHLPAMGGAEGRTKGGSSADTIVLHRLLQSRNARTRAEAEMLEREAHTPKQQQKKPVNSPPPSPRSFTAERKSRNSPPTSKQRDVSPLAADGNPSISAIHVLDALCADPSARTLDLSKCPSPLPVDDLFYVVHTVQRLRQIHNINVKGHTFGVMEARLMVELVQQCEHLLVLETDDRTLFHPEERHAAILANVQQILAARRAAKDGAAAEAKVQKASKASRRERANAMAKEANRHKEAAQLEALVVNSMTAIDTLFKAEALSFCELYATYHLVSTYLLDSAALTQAAAVSNLQLHILRTAAAIVNDEGVQWNKILLNHSSKLTDLKLRQQRQEEAMTRHALELERRERKRVEQLLRELGRQCYLKVDPSERPARREIEAQRDSSFDALFTAYRLFLKTSRTMEALNRLYADFRLVVESTGRQAIDTEIRQFKTRQRDAIEGRVRAINDTAKEFETLLGGPPPSFHSGSHGASTGSRHHHSSMNSAEGCPMGDGTGLWAEKRRLLEQATRDVIHWLRIERTKARMLLSPVPPTVALKQPCRELIVTDPSIFAQPVRLADAFDVQPPLPRYMQPSHRAVALFEADEPSPDAWIRQKSTIHQLILTASLRNPNVVSGAPSVQLKAFAHNLGPSQCMEAINNAQAQYTEALEAPPSATWTKKELAAARIAAQPASSLPIFPSSVPILVVDGSPMGHSGAKIVMAATGACVGTYTVDSHTGQHIVLLTHCTNETIAAALNCFSIVSSSNAGFDEPNNPSIVTTECSIGGAKGSTGVLNKEATRYSIGYDIKCLFLPPIEKGMGNQASASFNSIGSLGDMGLLMPVQSSLVSQGALIAAEVSHTTVLHVIPPFSQVPAPPSAIPKPLGGAKMIGSSSSIPTSLLDPTNTHRTIHYSEAQGPVPLWKGAMFAGNTHPAVSQGLGNAYVTLQFHPMVDRLDCFTLGPSLQVEDRMFVCAEGDMAAPASVATDSIHSPTSPAPPTNTKGALPTMKSFRSQAAMSQMAPHQASPPQAGVLRKVIVFKGEVIAVILEGGPLKYDGSPYWTQNIQSSRNKVSIATALPVPQASNPSISGLAPTPPVTANPANTQTLTARAGRQRGATFVKGRTHSEPPAEPTEAEIVAAHKAQLIQKRRNVAALQLQVQALAPTHPPITVLQLTPKATGETLQALMRGIYYTNDSWMLVEDERLLLFGVATNAHMSLDSGQLITAPLFLPNGDKSPNSKACVPLPLLSYSAVRIVAEGKDNPTTIHLGFPSVLLYEDSIISDSHALSLLKARGRLRGKYLPSPIEIDNMLRGDQALASFLRRLHLMPPRTSPCLSCRIAPAAIIHDDDDNYFSGGFLTIAVTEGFQSGTDRLEIGPPLGVEDDGIRVEGSLLYFRDELVACISRTVVAQKGEAPNTHSYMKRSVLLTAPKEKEKSSREGPVISMPGTTLRLDDIEPDARITFIFSSPVAPMASAGTNTDFDTAEGAAPTISPSLVEFYSSIQPSQRAPHGYSAAMLQGLLSRIIFTVKAKAGSGQAGIALSHVHQRRRTIKIEFSHDDTKPARAQVWIVPSPPLVSLAAKDSEMVVKEQGAAIPVVRDITVARPVMEMGGEGAFTLIQVASGFESASDLLLIATSPSLQLLEIGRAESPLTALLEASAAIVPTTATSEVAQSMAIAKLRAQTLLQVLAEAGVVEDEHPIVGPLDGQQLVSIVDVSARQSPTNNSISVNTEANHPSKIKRKNSNSLLNPLGRNGGLLSNGQSVAARVEPIDYLVFFGEAAAQAGLASGIARIYPSGKVLFYHTEVDKAKALKMLKSSISSFRMSRPSSSNGALVANKSTTTNTARAREITNFIRHVRFSTNGDAITSSHRLLCVSVCDGKGSLSTVSIHLALQSPETTLRIMLPNALEALLATGDATQINDVPYRADEDPSAPCCFLDGATLEELTTNKTKPDYAGATVIIKAIAGADPTDMLTLASDAQQKARYHQRRFEERLGKYFVESESQMEKEIAVASAQTVAAMAAAQNGGKRRRTRSLITTETMNANNTPTASTSVLTKLVPPTREDPANGEGWEEFKTKWGVSLRDDGALLVGSRPVGTVSLGTSPPSMEIFYNDGKDMSVSAKLIEATLSAVLFTTGQINPQKFTAGRRHIEVRVRTKGSPAISRARITIDARPPVIARMAAPEERPLLYKFGSLPLRCLPGFTINSLDKETTITGGSVEVCLLSSQSISERHHYEEATLGFAMNGFQGSNLAVEETFVEWPGLTSTSMSADFLTTPPSPTGNLRKEPVPSSCSTNPSDFRFDSTLNQIFYMGNFVCLLEISPSEIADNDRDIVSPTPTISRLKLVFDSTSRCSLAHIETLVQSVTMFIKGSSSQPTLEACICVSINATFGETPMLPDPVSEVLSLRRTLKGYAERPIQLVGHDLPTEIILPSDGISVAIPMDSAPQFVLRDVVVRDLDTELFESPSTLELSIEEEGCQQGTARSMSRTVCATLITTTMPTDGELLSILGLSLKDTPIGARIPILSAQLDSGCDNRGGTAVSSHEVAAFVVRDSIASLSVSIERCSVAQLTNLLRSVTYHSFTPQGTTLALPPFGEVELSSSSSPVAGTQRILHIDLQTNATPRTAAQISVSVGQSPLTLFHFSHKQPIQQDILLQLPSLVSLQGGGSVRLFGHHLTVHPSLSVRKGISLVVTVKAPRVYVTLDIQSDVDFVVRLDKNNACRRLLHHRGTAIGSIVSSTPDESTSLLAASIGADSSEEDKEDTAPIGEMQLSEAIHAVLSHMVLLKTDCPAPVEGQFALVTLGVVADNASALQYSYVTAAQYS